MTETVEYKKKEWYQEVSIKVASIFVGDGITNNDMLIVLAMVLKGMSAVAKQGGISEPNFLNMFKEVYEGLKVDKPTNEVKKE